MSLATRVRRDVRREDHSRSRDLARAATCYGHLAWIHESEFSHPCRWPILFWACCPGCPASWHLANQRGGLHSAGRQRRACSRRNVCQKRDRYYTRGQGATIAVRCNARSNACAHRTLIGQGSRNSTAARNPSLRPHRRLPKLSQSSCTGIGLSFRSGSSSKRSSTPLRNSTVFA